MSRMSMVMAAAAVLVCGGISGCAHDEAADTTQGGIAQTAATAAGAGSYDELHSGDLLPRRYRTQQYVIDHWSRYKLAAPPPGYHWVQAGDDYLLVSGETGVIERVVPGR